MTRRRSPGSTSDIEKDDEYEYDSEGIDTNELCASPPHCGDGRRHAGYGVKERDYETVGEALLWTLEQGLGPGFTPEIREAWTGFYQLVADTMLGAPGPL